MRRMVFHPAGMEQINLRKADGGVLFEACRAAPSGDHDIKKATNLPCLNIEADIVTFRQADIS